MKFSVKDFFSRCDQIRSILRIWSHLLTKSLMKNFIFCAVLRLFCHSKTMKSCKLYLLFSCNREDNEEETKTGALPMLNMPRKSYEKLRSVPRRILTKNNILEYLHSSSLPDFITKVKKVRLPCSWLLETHTYCITIKYLDEAYNVSKYMVTIDSGLSYTVKVFDLFAPEDYQFYKVYKRSINNVDIIDLLNTLTSAAIYSSISPHEVTSQATYYLVPFQ